jgi:DNA-binding Xre family transcriptional regulator
VKEHVPFEPPKPGGFSFRARGYFMSEATGIDRVWRYKPMAQSLGISTKTLQRLVARGEIATVQISDRIKGITESERRRFIESRTMGAA